MKVTQSTSSPVQGSDVAAAKQATKASGAQDVKKTEKAKGAEAKAGVEGSVNAELSSKGKEMAAAKAAAAAAPETREEKIEALKARINGGHYKVDAEAVADRMVEEHLKSGIG